MLYNPSWSKQAIDPFSLDTLIEWLKKIWTGTRTFTDRFTVHFSLPDGSTGLCINLRKSHELPKLQYLR